VDQIQEESLLEDREITRGFVTRKLIVLGTSLDDDDDDDDDNDSGDDDDDDDRCVYFLILPTVQISS
jgi:hypothetical protein